MEINQLAKQYIYWPEIDNKYQKNFDFSNTKVSDIAAMLNDASEQPKESVTAAIARFYSLNEALGKLRQQEQDILTVESMELYKQYTQEMEKLSKQMFAYIFTICAMEARHCHDYGHLRTIKRDLESSYLYKPNGPEKVEAKVKIANKKYFKDHYRKHIPNLAEYKTFLKFHSLIKNISNLGSYDRVDVNEQFIPLLTTPEFADLTVGEILQSLKTMFTVNIFSSSYGGLPWANITDHALKFVKGDLNAEVFIDQAFSLEHNGGQIFNKALIFKTPSGTHLNYTDYSPAHESYGQEVHTHATQIVLNMQHQGQLLGFLLNPLAKTDLSLITDFSYKAALKSNMIPSDLKYDQYVWAANHFKSNIDNLEELRLKIINNSPTDFFKNINKLNIKGEQFSFTHLFENLQSKGLVLDLSDKHKEFLKLQDSLAYNFNLHATKNIVTKPIKKHIKEFVFEHFDTAAIPKEKMHKEILGNKAFGLAEMQQINLPVPKAIVFPATNSASFFAKKTEWNKNLKAMLPQMKEYFKDSDNNPVLCSIRSGSAISMPGMMDTILNVGIDNTNYEQFCKTLGKGVTNECAIKFMTLFTKSLLGEQVKYSSNINGALKKFRKVLTKHNIPHNKLGMFPLKAEAQYQWCLQAVFSSWHSERATAYRNHQNISHDIGTAAIAQQMVFGNLNNKSCTGVAFSRDCISGEKGIIGEFLPKAQGEDVVSGAVTPKNIKEMAEYFPQAYKELVQICERLEKDTGDIQDIEFTVENQKLYILQKRKAVSSDLATTKLNFELMEKGLISKDTMISNLKVKSLLNHDVVVNNNQPVLGNGLIANPGILRGIVIHSEADMSIHEALYAQHSKDKNFGWIFYAPETSPEHAPIMIKTHGFITGNGGFTSHAAILARSWKKPCVVGVGEEFGNTNLQSGSLVTLDATNGHIYSGLLEVSANRNSEMKKVINALLKHHRVDIKNFKKVNPFEETVKSFNDHTTWMETIPQCKLVKPKIKPQVSSFLKLGEKIAMLLVKSQEDKAANKIINQISNDELTTKEKVACAVDYDNIEAVIKNTAPKTEPINKLYDLALGVLNEITVSGNELPKPPEEIKFNPFDEADFLFSTSLETEKNKVRIKI